MPVTHGIGHSEQTINKQIGVGALLVQHISIVKSVLNKCFITLQKGDVRNEE